MKNKPEDSIHTKIDHAFRWGRKPRTNVLGEGIIIIIIITMTADAHWYLPNTVIRRDMQTPIVKQEIRRCSSQHIARLCVHSDDLVVNLMAQPDNRKLRRYQPNDLHTKF
jgi:hypothetical protein